MTPATRTDAVITARGLQRRYGTGKDAHVAVAGIDLTVHRGELFALLGTNGAGKTSTLEVLEGLARPSAGSVSVFGLDPITGRDAVRSCQGLMLQTGEFPSDLTVRESLGMCCATLSRPAPIVTSHPRPGHLKRALEMGVLGFLPKTAAADKLAAAIRAVHAGRRAIDPELAAETIASGSSPLTPREADVLELAEGGTSISQIARRTHLAEGTVRNYLSSAQAKLQARNRHEAVATARRHGWI